MGRKEFSNIALEVAKEMRIVHGFDNKKVERLTKLLCVTLTAKNWWQIEN